MRLLILTETINWKYHKCRYVNVMLSLSHPEPDLPVTAREQDQGASIWHWGADAPRHAGCRPQPPGGADRGDRELHIFTDTSPPAQWAEGTPSVHWQPEEPDLPGPEVKRSWAGFAFVMPESGSWIRLCLLDSHYSVCVTFGLITFSLSDFVLALKLAYFTRLFLAQ